jgi:hypothetical protein
MLVYLSGPMSGIKDYNFPEFMRITKILRDTFKWSVINPAEEDNLTQEDLDKIKDFSVDEEKRMSFLIRDIILMITRGINGIVMMPGWENSKGAKIELFIAMYVLHIPVYRYIDMHNGHSRTEPALLSGTVKAEFVVVDLPYERADVVTTVVDGKLFEKIRKPSDSDGSANIAVGGKMPDPTKGRKFDTNKPDWYQIPYDELEQVVKVLTLGAQKYDDFNWQRLEGLRKRYFSACMRHLIARKDGKVLDDESKLPHIAHAICCLLFMLWKDNEDAGTHGDRTDRF